MADGFHSFDSLQTFKKDLMQKAEESKVYFFNFKQILEENCLLLKQGSCPPFAIVNPTDHVTQRRARIDGWTDCNSFDFDQLFKVVFEILPS